MALLLISVNMTRSINEVAIGLLSRREHSVLEIKQKLKLRGFTDDEIDQSVERLLENNLLSEERFTESYINMRKHRGFGPLRIANELRERGVDSGLVDSCMDKENSEWKQVMRQQYEKKYGEQPAKEYAEQVKRSKYLQSRGFPLDWVFKINSLDEAL
jgi:regulatory protein